MIPAFIAQPAPWSIPHGNIIDSDEMIASLGGVLCRSDQTIDFRPV
jgi:hypothetical protein